MVGSTAASQGPSQTHNLFIYLFIFISFRTVEKTLSVIVSRKAARGLEQGRITTAALVEVIRLKYAYAF